MRRVMTLALLGLAGCCLSTVDGSTDGTAGGGGTSGTSGRTAGSCGLAPTNHRPSDAQCQTMAAPGNYTCSGDCPPPGSGQRFECNGDAECDAGLEGRCVEGCCVASSSCTYDQCTFDRDCPADQTCACHGSPYLAPADNTCVPGDCRVDADCRSGCACSPSQRPGCWGCVSYHCHTPQDRCVNDADCQAQFPGDGFCVYASDAGHWECAGILAPL
jgi:hypothetical protein